MSEHRRPVSFMIDSLFQASNYLKESEDRDSSEETPAEKEINQQMSVWNNFHRLPTSKTDPSRPTLIITNIKGKISEEKLHFIFSEYGRVTSIYLCNPKLISTDNNFLRTIPMKESFARIQFDNDESYHSALKEAKVGLLRINNNFIAATLISGDESPIRALNNNRLGDIFLKISDTRTKLILEEVCKCWKEVASKSWENIKSLDQSLYSERINVDKLEEILIQCNNSLIELKVDLSNESLRILTFIENYCKNLRHIVIKYNPWIDTSEIIRNIVNTLREKNTLRRICLESIDDNSDFGYLQYLSENIKELHLFAKHMELNNAGSVMDLSSFRRLKVLHLCSFSFFGQNSLMGLEYLTDLTHLSLIHTSIHHRSFARLAFISRLERLEIPSQRIDDHILSMVIRNNENLKYLNISDIPGPLNNTFERIISLRNLDELIMKNLYYLDGKLLRQLVGVRLLDCEGCSLFGDSDFLALIHFSKKLREINISNTDATERLSYCVEKEKRIEKTEGMLIITVSDQSYIDYWKRSMRKSGQLILRLRDFDDEVLSEWNSWKTKD